MYALFSDEIWLPPNLSWRELEVNFEYEDGVPSLLLALPLAFVVLTLRFFVEKFCFVPIGRRLSIRGDRRKSSPNPVLERAYAKQKKYDHKQIQGLAKQLDLSELEVERWLKIRAREEKATTLDKFCESSWRFVYYSMSFVFGCIVLWEKAWLWDIKECWRRYPYEPRTLDVYWYYTISLSYYYAVFLTQFFDVWRKDFWQMFVHHLATISLLVMSWCCRMHAIGTLILLLHDFADIFLEVTKITKYCGCNKISIGLFGIFASCWIITRNVVFPAWIVKSTMFDVLEYHKPYPGYVIFNCFLTVLCLLHVMWTCLIIKLIYRVIKAGDAVDDVRSDSDSSD